MILHALGVGGREGFGNVPIMPAVELRVEWQLVREASLKIPCGEEMLMQ